MEDETVDVALVSSELHVERHAINRVIADGAAPAVRQDGATTIYPIVKEVLVTEKRLLLVAEVHVRRVDLTFHEPQTVSLRKEEIVIERMDDAITPSTKQP